MSFSQNNRGPQIESFWTRTRIVSFLGTIATVLFLLNFSSFLSYYLSPPLFNAQHLVSSLEERSKSSLHDGIGFHRYEKEIYFGERGNLRTRNSRCWGHPDALKYYSPYSSVHPRLGRGYFNPPNKPRYRGSELYDNSLGRERYQKRLKDYQLREKTKERIEVNGQRVIPSLLPADV